MKNKKTTFFYLCFLFAGFSSAQSHYMVQWDRLQNEISYFQIEYQNGKKVETPIKKPLLKEGDILEGKIVNVNEFAFQPVVRVNKRILNENKNGNFIGTALGGLGLLNLGTGFFGAIAKITEISQNQNGITLGTRGESVSSDQKKKISNWEKTILADIQNIGFELNSVQKAQSEYTVLNNIIHSEVLNLDNFKQQATQQIEKIKKLDLGNAVEHLTTSTEEIKSILNSAKEEGLIEEIDEDLRKHSREVLSIYESLNPVNIANSINGNQIQLLEKEISNADFTYSDKFLIEDWKGSEYGSEITSVDQTQYDIDFQIFKRVSSINNIQTEEIGSVNESNVPNSYTQLVSHKLISINAESSLKPVWTTGLVYHLPLGANYAVQSNRNYNRDSVRFSNGKKLGGGIGIATHLMFELGNFEKIIPNVSLGVSYKINEFQEGNNDGASESISSNMSVLIGGGLRTRGFKYFSFNAGFSWSQTQVLNTDLAKGVAYDVFELEESGISAENYLESKWTPALFVGFGFHF
jgi:hypothetical protein